MNEHKMPARRTRPAADLAAVRAEVSRLCRMIADRDCELERALDRLAGAGLSGGDDEDVRYGLMMQRLRRLVSDCFDGGRSAVVVSGGDEALLQHASCRAVHLAQDRTGTPLPGQPQSSRVAVAQLEAARADGADLLILPESNRWWLEHYADFARYLDRQYAQLASEAGAGVLWDLSEPSPLRGLDDLLTELRASPAEPTILDWQADCDVAKLLSECNVVAPEQEGKALPYLDASFDIVALGAGASAEMMEEGRRVASAALVTFTRCGAQPTVGLDRRLDDPSERWPHVSVVLASRDGRAPSRRFLRRLRETLPGGFETELLFPVAREARMRSVGSDVTVVRCRDHVFGRRVRAGVAAAAGEFVVIISSDIWPAAGWLPPLVNLLRQQDGVGVVSGCLVTPDGKADREAGAVDGEGGAEGDDASPADNYVRRTAAVADELFATRRQLLLDHRRLWSRRREPVRRFCDVVAKDGMSVLSQPETLAVRPWSNRETAPRVDAPGRKR